MISIMKRNKPSIDKEIETLLKRLKEVEPSSEEYEKILKHIDVLSKANSYDTKGKLGADTVALIGGNLVGIVLILCWETVNVITSKALGFVIKGRV